jgi:O-antigen biosynthesis protein
MELSVVIVSYNVKHFLGQCLGSVRKASGGLRCEIFVVDNNSADGSCSMVSTEYPEVKLIRNFKNTGFSAACNQAIRLAAGKYILLLNPDTVVGEDTFTKCLDFMESRQDAGAVGVKMVNGSGKLLPEARRSLPTPSVAFFKVTGLSGLFPGSPVFNRYYLGHLDNSKTTEAEILSGAFMFIRRTALEKSGFLDESFFLYGEDIDLSYRITRAGFKNYYFPEVKIIHYKGESTGSVNINAALHFYKAMLIFIRKHFKVKRYSPYLFLLSLSVYLLGAAAIIKKLVSRYLFPVTDTLLIYLVFTVYIVFWGTYRFGNGYRYPGLFSNLLIPFVIAATLLSVYLSGGYRRPSKPGTVLKGAVFSAAAVLTVYSLLPAGYRFSRAVILLGSLTIIVILPLSRLLASLLGSRSVINPFKQSVRTAIVCSRDNYDRIISLAASKNLRQEISGRVSILPDDLGPGVLGTVSQLAEIIKINRIGRIILSGKDLSASQLISTMQSVSSTGTDIRISPEGENVLIGGGDASAPGEL